MFVFELVDAILKLFVDMLTTDGRTLLLWFIAMCSVIFVFAFTTYFFGDSSNTSK